MAIMQHGTATTTTMHIPTDVTISKPVYVECAENMNLYTSSCARV